MNPTTRLPVNREVAPEIGHGWKGTRMSREDITLRIRHTCTTPRRPPQPSIIELHSIHQVHGDTNEHVLLEPIVRSWIIHVLPTQRDETVRQLVIIPID